MVDAELTRFTRLSAGFEPRDTHKFRHAHRQHFPSLYLAAASCLGAAGSSAACEREFSIVGRLVRAERSTLSPVSVELRSLVSANADLVPTDTTTVPVLTHADAARLRAGMNTFVPLSSHDVNAESDSESDEGDDGGDAAEWQ